MADFVVLAGKISTPKTVLLTEYVGILAYFDILVNTMGFVTFLNQFF